MSNTPPLDLDGTCPSPRDPADSCSAVPRRELRFCIPPEFPGDACAAGPGPDLEQQVCMDRTHVCLRPEFESWPRFHYLRGPWENYFPVQEFSFLAVPYSHLDAFKNPIPRSHPRFIKSEYLETGSKHQLF